MSKSPRRDPRRRTGSSSRRHTPSDLVRMERRSEISKEGIVAGIAVSIVAAMMIALIWVAAERSIDETRQVVREQAEQHLAAEAAVLADKVRLEMLVVDQSLTILQDGWTADPDGFQLTDWHKRMPALTAVADDIFIADGQRVIQQDVLPAAVGQGIGAAYLNFPHGSLEVFTPDGLRARESRFVNAPLGSTVEARRYLVYIIRPLGTPPKLMLGASFRSGEIPRHYADAARGYNGLVLLIDRRQGVLQAIAGPASRRPRTNLNRTELFDTAKRTESGIWSGPGGVDQTIRLHAYKRVAERDSIVVVAMPLSIVMRPAEELADAHRGNAAVATGLVAAIGALIVWGLARRRADRRRRRALERAQSDLAAAQGELGVNRLRTATAAAQVRAMLDGTADAAAVFDSDLKLALWNERFAAASMIPEEALAEGLSLDEAVRQQCLAGAFGDVDDVESETMRRAQIIGLGTDDASGLTQVGPGGAWIPVLSRRMPDSGVVVFLGGLSRWTPPPRVAPKPEPAPMPEPVAEAAPQRIEW